LTNVHGQSELPGDNSPNAPIVSTVEDTPNNSGSQGDCIEYDKSNAVIAVGCDATFSELESAIGDSPVLRDEGNGTYTIDASILVEDGATFSMVSPEIRWLRLEDRSHIDIYGKVEFIGVKITSWDTQTNSEIISVNGTDFRGWIKFEASEGGVIKNSEIAHLGYQSSIEGRAGFDLEGTRDLEISDSIFHHMYFAFYSDDSYNLKIVDSEFHSNILYALDPHSETRALEIRNNHVHHNKGFGIICSLNCNDLLIEGNEVHDNGNAGIMLSRNTTGSIVRHNHVYNHTGDDGIVVSQSSGNHIYDNVLTNNRQGIYLKVASDNNTIERNKITNSKYGVVVGTLSENNRARANTIENMSLAEYYLFEDASLMMENTPFWKVRIDAGEGLNTIYISNSGMVFLFPGTYDTNSEIYTQTMTNTSVELRGELQSSEEARLLYDSMAMS
jgi:parallel beta-helix repeat protein